MAKLSETLKMIASKLGLSGEEKVLSKACEYERLLQMKSTANSNITDVGKVVICLHVAATLYGAEFDVKTAQKYSGLKSQYANCKKIVENLLELNCDKLTTNILCLSLSCGVQELADRVLEEYQKCAKLAIDMSLPQYVCMAVYQACRINKIKVPKSKLIEKSRLKPAQWAKLDAEWAKVVDEKFAVPNKKGRPAKNPDIEDKEEKMEIDCPSKAEEPTEPQMESYDEWKTRILDAAYTAIKEMETKKIIKKLKNSPQKQQTNDKKRTKITEDKPKQSETCFKIVLEQNTSKHDLKPQKLKEHDVTIQNNDKKSPKKPLLVLNNIDDCVRRSPRKTPQKYEPYTSPTKKNGVRLLFPL